MNSKNFKRISVIYFILTLGGIFLSYYTVKSNRSKVSIHFYDKVDPEMLNCYTSIDSALTDMIIYFTILFFILANLCLYWSSKLKAIEKNS